MIKIHIFALILDFYRSGGTLSPFTSTKKYSQQAIHAEVDFFQLPCSPPVVEIDEDASFGDAMTQKSLASARASLDQHLYGLLKRQVCIFVVYSFMFVGER
jgi:hypothetical protein